MVRRVYSKDVKNSKRRKRSFTGKIWAAILRGSLYLLAAPSQHWGRGEPSRAMVGAESLRDGSQMRRKGEIKR